MSSLQVWASGSSIALGIVGIAAGIAFARDCRVDSSHCIGVCSAYPTTTACAGNWNVATEGVHGQEVDSVKVIKQQCCTYANVVQIGGCGGAPSYIRICMTSCCYAPETEQPVCRETGSNISVPNPDESGYTPCVG